MISLLIVIIYVAFISLGLPDSLLGSAWPIIKDELNIPLSYAGILTMVISGCTIISSLFTDRLIKKLGTGKVTAISVLLTALGLLGFSIAPKFYVLIILAVPYGIGAGAVDAALNNYVALHYSSKHMSWLHAFWGIGVTISPYIMSLCLTNNLGWRSGYLIVGIIQSVFVIFLFSTLSIWKKNDTSSTEDVKTNVLSVPSALKLIGAKEVLLSFLLYCAFEGTAGLWATTYLVDQKEVSLELAAEFCSLFYIGLTTGRILNGFVADKLGDKKMIRIGTIIMLIGTILILLPININIFALIGLVIIGLGCAPIYPSIIHSTPDNFGKENSQSLVGIQMASAYIGSTFMPPLFGILAEHISVSLYPLFLLILVILLIIMTERSNRLFKKTCRN